MVLETYSGGDPVPTEEISWLPATFPTAVRLVKAPELGTLLPIVPGASHVLPSSVVASPVIAPWMIPPTHRSLAMLTPPSVEIAPVVPDVSVASVSEVLRVSPSTVRLVRTRSVLLVRFFWS